MKTLWLLFLLGYAIFDQGLARPQEDYQEDGDGEDYNDGDEDAEDSGPIPTIRSAKTTQVVDIGGVAFLPCDVDGNPDAFTRIWRKGATGLFLGTIKQTDDIRISNLDNGTLEIRQIQPSDAGTYSCKISTEKEDEVQHVLLVKGAAEIVNFSPSEKTTIKKGSSLTLECKVRGYPNPAIKWFHNGRYLNEQDNTFHGERYTIGNATLQDSGFYKCTATNDGQQQPAEYTVEIEVQYPPQIQIERATVPTGEGYEAELKCVVTGMKKPHLKWYKNGEQKPLVASEKFKIERKGDDHILLIRKVQASDFGDYTCEAKNSEGQEQAVITLTGKPARPELDTVITEDESKNPLLTFRVESYAPIEDYELLYKRDEKDEWFSLKPKVTPSKDHIYIVKYTLTGLEPGVYNAQLKAKNANGWSEMSSKVTFPKAVGVAAASELRISLALIVSLLVAHFYC